MRHGGSAAALVLVALFTVACASPAPTSPPEPSPSPSPASLASAAPSPTPSPALPSPGGEALIDPALLEVLPDRLGELPVRPAPDALAGAVTDPAIVRNVAALAAAIVVDPATSEFAYATVMRFTDRVPSDAFYRDWRDTYDEGACEQAGGVSGKAEAEIGGRQVFIGSCAGGAHTYHAWLGNRGVLVSVSAVGEQRLGERLVEELKD